MNICLSSGVEDLKPSGLGESSSPGDSFSEPSELGEPSTSRLMDIAEWVNPMVFDSL